MFPIGDFETKNGSDDKFPTIYIFCSISHSAPLKGILIEIEPPVARRPPHRTRRAILPHRAPQDCSPNKQ